MASMSWLDHLNAVDPSSNSNSPTASGRLEGVGGFSTTSTNDDDLRAQLEAWTNVDFGGSASEFDAFATAPAFRDLEDDSAAKDAKVDPSPYAKRPFGQFGHNYTFDRGFSNAFNQSPDVSAGGGSQIGANNGVHSAPMPVPAIPANNNNSFHDLYSGFIFAAASNGSNSPISSDGAAPVWANPNLQTPDLLAGKVQTLDKHSNESANAITRGEQHQILANFLKTVSHGSSASPRPASTEPSSEPAAKKQRTSSIPSNTASPIDAATTPSTSYAAATPGASTDANSTKAALTKSQTAVLTKAAILAEQAEKLKAQKGLTDEEEAARLEELARIEAEDDKRRRNTAASARFRVKKKQREAALEDTVKGLNERIERLEKDLEASKAENNFLRDLVIRKVGLSDLPGPTGSISGGQEGRTGMGTRA